MCYDSNTSTRREGLDYPLQKQQVERIQLKEQKTRQKTNSIHQPSGGAASTGHKKQSSTIVKPSKGS